MDPSRALYIGGGQGVGKSSVAWALSRRHGLQLYTIDHRTQAHLPRHRPHEFFELSEDERWVEPEVETMLAWFVETLLIAARVSEEARALGLAALIVDRPLAETIDLADRRLAPAVARLARGGDLSGARRRENAAIVEQVRLWRATGHAPATYPPLQFACECGRLGCAETVELDLDAAERGPIVAAACTP